MKHTPGPVEASMLLGPYPICLCEHEKQELFWFVNAEGPVRESPEDDARFIAWCYNNAPMLAAAPAMYEALEAVEWVSHDERWWVCPWCMKQEHDGHAPDCQRQAALAAARGES